MLALRHVYHTKNVSIDPPFKYPHFFNQLEFRAWFIGVEKVYLTLITIPPTAVEAIFSAMSECQALHPDEDEDEDEVEDDGDGMMKQAWKYMVI